MKLVKVTFFIVVLAGLFTPKVLAEFEKLTFEPGHPSLQSWLLPDVTPAPDSNLFNQERAELGKKLFFDPRLSGDKNMSCASCHSPLFGWSDGLETAKGNKSLVLGRASPTVMNSGFNSIQMWDGRAATLEDQAMGPMKSNEEMNMNIDELMHFLSTNPEYSALFKKAYPSEPIGEATLAKALASFERTLISNNSPFDQWIKGDAKALTQQQVNGFKVFMDPNKGKCAVCHSGANFTDNGFHNIGLPSYGEENPDMGRYSERPLGLMKGAFKTPGLRDITLTAPYFHDGSAKTLKEVVEHYQSGGKVKTNIAPNFSPAELSDSEVNDLIAFMEALTTPSKPFKLPTLPLTY